MIALPVERVAAAHAASLSMQVDCYLEPLQIGTPGPWRVAIASMVIYRSKDRECRRALKGLFSAWPDPVALASSEIDDVHDQLRGAHLPYARASKIRQFSQRFVDGNWTDLRDLPSVGLYVAEAVGLFCFGYTVLTTDDRKLQEYAKWVATRAGSVESVP